MKKHKNVALVLSSGGAKGFAHVGVINTLNKHGFNIHSIAGCSMGALIGGLYATGELDIFVDFMKELDFLDMLKFYDISLGAGGMVKGEKIIAQLNELIPDRDIKDLNLPFCAVATDIVSGKEKVFSSGKLYDAIRASISIPTFFTPHVIDGQHYVDGGVVNPIPVNRVQRKKRDILVAVNVNDIGESKVPEKEAKREKNYDKLPESIQQFLEKAERLLPRNKGEKIGTFNITNRSINLMLNRICELTLQLDPPDIQIDIILDSYGILDFYKSQEIIKSGEIAAEKAIEEYLSKR
ncbi:MAG: patatin-like phospholipase family protein [Candidatus Neomarinimicrobiota bacterium]